MKLITFVQHSKNQQGNLFEDRGKAYQYPASPAIVLERRRPSKLISDMLCHRHDEECQLKKAAKLLKQVSFWSVNLIGSTSFSSKSGEDSRVCDSRTSESK